MLGTTFFQGGGIYVGTGHKQIRTRTLFLAPLMTQLARGQKENACGKTKDGGSVYNKYAKVC